MKKQTPTTALRDRCACGSKQGTWTEKNGNVVVRCAECNKYAFNAPYDWTRAVPKHT